ncbi:hypothetical protein SAY86_008379 [Trapa natans]|uniref:Uncharacterized protein n=1 Tax=Trapa natans TaxID=22666 RepID=A0AAN7K9D2_TRANT|nr:hypothetical protein SAY86_008379 [Trapa natans]
MDIKGASRFHGAKSLPSRDRFLGDFLYAPSQNPSPASSAAGDELSEDDIFSTGDFSADAKNSHSQPSTPSSSSSSTPSRVNGRQNHLSAFGQPDSFGILAALPENETRSVFIHKIPVSSSTSSRPVPTIPKPPGSILYPAVNYHQSAPVNVPSMPSSAISRSPLIECNEVGAIKDEAEDEDEPMLPPHETVARRLAKSPILSCSVLEGVGRTLKGRDLRQVRNAVWRQTDFALLEVAYNFSKRCKCK